VAIHVSPASASQYAEASSAPAISLTSGGQFTLSALYRPTGFDSGTVLSIGSSTSSNRYIALAMLDTGQGFFEVQAGASPSDAFGGASNLLTDGAWNHILGVQSSSTARQYYTNGVAGALDTASVPFDGTDTPLLDRVTVGALHLLPGIVSDAQGDIAEVAIWNVDLTSSEIAMLAAHVCPLLVRPQGLILYSALKGTPNGPEQDLIGGRSLVYGATTASPTPAAHPGVIGPVRMPTSGPPAGGTSVTLTPAVDSSSAQGLTHAKSVTIGAATATSTAQALSHAKHVTAAPATTAESAQVLTQAVHVALTPVALATAAQVLRAAKQRAVTAVTDTTTAQALVKLKRATISPAVMVDSARALLFTHIHYRTLTPATGTTTALILTATGHQQRLTATLAAGATDTLVLDTAARSVLEVT
jgi:hypothetical protein